MSAAGEEELHEQSSPRSEKTIVRRSIAVVGDRIESRDIFDSTREIIIGHGDDVYRLRLTAQNKLILTK